MIQHFFQIKESYKDKSDEDLIELFKSGNEDVIEFLMNKYKDLVNAKVAKYFIIGAEREDIVQEGLIGLFKAIKSFDNGKQSSFKSFANLCIERQLITAIKTSNRQKHIPLNSSLSLNNTVYDENDEVSFIDILDLSGTEDPLDTITKKEYYRFVENKMDTELSDFEKKVLYIYAKGESYTDIARRLEAPVKSVDNAIQRIRKKANKNILEEI